MLTACNTRLVPSVDQADNAIVLRAGISEGPAGVQTKAVDNPDANHDVDGTYGGGHLLFTQGTYARLRVDGIWKKTGAGEAVDVKQITTIQLGARSSETGNGQLHNLVSSYDPMLYWDDYGTADPLNATVGRTRGLEIYGVAVDGYKTSETFSLPSELNLAADGNWTSLSWTLEANQKVNDWKNKDLLISNNVKYSETSANDNAYKFESRADGKLIEFTHAMSKVTFILTAGEGFPVADDKPIFESTPDVTLTSRKAGDSTTPEWAQTTGTVNVETGVVTLPDSPVPSSFSLHHANTDAGTKKVTLDALIFPRSEFADRANESSPYPTVARIEADGNVYYITTEKIREAIAAAHTAGKHGESCVTEPGKNYVFKVTINKTEIKVTATVKDWITVESEEVPPVINVSANWGTTTGASSVDGFSFYRSLSLDNGYSDGFSANANGYFAAEAKATKPGTPTDQWPFVDGSSNLIKLYWPTHNTHYQFRGVWPNTSVLTTDTETAPHVRNESSVQVIDIKNVAYSTTNNYPSNLMIARPEFGLDTDGITPLDPECTNSDHTHKHLYSDGICATEGLITLNFRYVMSQVEVVLSTSDGGSTDHVNIGANTVVEIVNVANEGYVKLGDRTVVPSTTKGNYTLDAVSGEGNELKRHSAIVPQTLTFSEAGASTNVRFKITVTNNDDTQDIYYADINPIKKAHSEAMIAPNGKWESGVHYKYSLKLTKTEIKVTATITDWVTVDAEEDIWF